MNIGFMSCFEPEYFPNFQTFSYKSTKSLLDFDLVLWCIEFLHFGYRVEFYDEEHHDLSILLDDRARRLQEIDMFLEQGKTLALMLAGPVRIGLSDHILPDVETIYKMSRRKVGRKVLEQIRIEGEQKVKAEDQLLANHGLSRDNLDIYSFLPEYIEHPLRKSSVPVKIPSNEIDFRGDTAYLSFWNCLHGKAWYEIIFSSPIGNPILFSAGTQYSVCTWYKHKMGNIILLPNAEYDTSDDYPLFVEATRQLISAIENPTHNQTEILWNRQKVVPESWYIDPRRLSELKALVNQQYDLTKLIRLCEEINACYSIDCLFAVTMLVRTIINHVPPIFGYQTFSDVANNYGGSSFKKSMQNLQYSLKNIADANLHLLVRKVETLPTKVQVNFSHDLDVLLSEIIRVLS